MSSRQSEPVSEARPALRAVVREPLVHFVLAAAALFALGSITRSGADVIEVSAEELAWRVLQVEAQEGAPLSEEERRLVEEAYIDERVLIREALEVGLEADERIDDILVQKMLHVLSGDVIQPTDEELRAFYEARQERYATPARISVDEVVVAEGGDLPRALLRGASPGELPEGSLVGYRTMPELTRDALAGILGPDAADGAFAVGEGDWVDAGASPRGQHWLRVREHVGRSVPALDVVRDAVRLDWIAEEEERLLLERVAELRARYTVQVNRGDAAGGATP